jgi:hypothetical protein
VTSPVLTRATVSLETGSTSSAEGRATSVAIRKMLRSG